MLAHLQVKNFALIEGVEVELAPGLNVITGETGAGKSLFVDAVQVALGARASADFVRTGADSAAVWALFILPETRELADLLAELGIEAPEGTVLVERELRREGANRARINDRLASVSAIGEFSRHMVELHGQHEGRGLLDPATQRDILDSVGGAELRSVRRRVGERVGELADIRRAQERLLGDDRERARRLDLLRYQKDEIEAARITPEEESALNDQRHRMANLETLRSGTASAVGRLSEGDAQRPALLEDLGEIAEGLERILAVDPELETAARTVESASLELEEVARSLRRYLENLSFDAEDQRRVEERLELIADLKRKYGGTVEEVLAYGRGVAREIEAIESSEEEAARLAEERGRVETALGEAARELGVLRHRAAKELVERVEAQLADLHMEDTRFEVDFARREDVEAGISIEGRSYRVGAHGAEDVEFLIAPNPGEPPLPLRRIASGGELARISLALESAAAAVASPPTLIFDEIDAGVGGRAGTAVARKLAELARTHQVLCVTHLAQIAALADAHFYLAKSVSGDRTASSVTALEGESRVEEVARMLSGDIDRDAAIEHARSMIAAGTRG